MHVPAKHTLPVAQSAVLVHVAARDTDALRAFVVDELSARPEISYTETSLIFEHIPAAMTVPPVPSTAARAPGLR